MLSFDAYVVDIHSLMHYVHLLVSLVLCIVQSRVRVEGEARGVKVVTVAAPYYGTACPVVHFVVSDLPLVSVCPCACS